VSLICAGHCFELSYFAAPDGTHCFRISFIILTATVSTSVAGRFTTKGINVPTECQLLQKGTLRWKERVSDVTIQGFQLTFIGTVNDKIYDIIASYLGSGLGQLLSDLLWHKLK
jgi:hypothetical protein